MVTIQELAKILTNLPLGYDVIMSQKMPPEKETLQTHKFTMVA